ncbi:hypothetical protein P3T73_13125 [Kiritimatiellota bacterium B12222]|nr:hypothetical protein P3T73_13125 [Kiritimatiellota bacterium B12222]
MPIPDPGWRDLSDGSVAFRRWLHPERLHVAYLIKKTNGSIITWTEYFSSDEFKHCWIQENPGGSFFDDDRLAEKELKGFLAWMKEVTAEERSNIQQQPSSESPSSIRTG